MQSARHTMNVPSPRRIIIYLIVGFSLIIRSAAAFDELNDAQAWVYDHSHLANTTEGQTLTYRYAGVDSPTESVEDEARLSVLAIKEDNRRDVDIEFLTDERHLPLPSFPDFRGNPVIIAMLEHVAQSMSTTTGGGALYFRNRIRDALASEDVSVEQAKITYHGDELNSTMLTFYPFLNDKYLNATSTHLKQARFVIEMSDEVPGGVVRVDVSAQNNALIFERKLSLM